MGLEVIHLFLLGVNNGNWTCVTHVGYAEVWAGLCLYKKAMVKK